MLSATPNEEQYSGNTLNVDLGGGASIYIHVYVHLCNPRGASYRIIQGSLEHGNRMPMFLLVLLFPPPPVLRTYRVRSHLEGLEFRGFGAWPGTEAVCAIA